MCCKKCIAKTPFHIAKIPNFSRLSRVIPRSTRIAKLRYTFTNLSPMQNQNNSDYQQYSYIYINWPFNIKLKKRTSDPLKLMFSVSGHLWPHPTNSSGLRCYLSLVNSISSWKSLCIKSRTLTVSFQGYRWSKKPVIGLDKTIVNNLKV